MDDDDDKAGALVAHAASTVLIARQGMRIDQLPSTLPRDADGIKTRFNAMGVSSLEMDRDGSLLIEISDVLAYWRDDVNEQTGEVSEFSWLVIIDPKGETWGTSSPIVAAKVGQIVSLWSAGLVERPTPVQIVTRTARKTGQRYHDVVMI